VIVASSVAFSAVKYAVRYASGIVFIALGATAAFAKRT
jgi:hypothetical protein